jgi:hypothetical protein
MRGFENHVSARATEAIHATGAQRLLEPLYRSYGPALASLVLVQQSRIHRYGSDLTEITAAPHC